MTKLKPCPFCGNKEVILMSCAICDGYIYCDGCGFETKRYWDDLKDHKVVKSWQEKAIAAWNRRDGEQIMKTVIATVIEKNNPRIKTSLDQAERTAWRCLKDWVEAQMALIEIGMVSIDQVFLPYVINKEGKTLYAYAKEHRLFLEGGHNG